MTSDWTGMNLPTVSAFLPVRLPGLASASQSRTRIVGLLPHSFEEHIAPLCDLLGSRLLLIYLHDLLLGRISRLVASANKGSVLPALIPGINYVTPAMLLVKFFFMAERLLWNLTAESESRVSLT